MKHGLFDTKEQGAGCKIDNGAGSRQNVMIILEQGAHKIMERTMEQRKMLKRSMKQKTKSRSQKKNEKGAGKKLKGARSIDPIAQIMQIMKLCAYVMVNDSGAD